MQVAAPPRPVRIRDQPFDIAGKKRGSCEAEQVHTRIHTSERVERVYLCERNQKGWDSIVDSIDFDFIISLCQFGPRHRWSQDCLSWPKMAPSWPKMAPSWPQRRPSWPQRRPRWAPNGPKRGPKSLPNRSAKAFQHRSRKRETPHQSEMRPGGRPTCILRRFFNILCCNLRGVRPIFRGSAGPRGPPGKGI